MVKVKFSGVTEMPFANPPLGTCANEFAIKSVATTKTIATPEHTNFSASDDFAKVIMMRNVPAPKKMKEKNIRSRKMGLFIANS